MPAIPSLARRARNRKRREKRRRGRRRKRWARSLVGRLSALVRSVGSGLCRWALNSRRWRARYIISQKTDKEDRELKNRSNTSRRIANKIDLDMGGARACRCNPGVDSVSGVCAAWWNTRYPLAKPSVLRARTWPTDVKGCQEAIYWLPGPTYSSTTSFGGGEES